jgi:hypothetical protein
MMSIDFFLEFMFFFLTLKMFAYQPRDWFFWYDCVKLTHNIKLHRPSFVSLFNEDVFRELTGMFAILARACGAPVKVTFWHCLPLDFFH